MNVSKYLLSVFAFVFAFIGAVATVKFDPPAPFYGIDPVSSTCKVGTIVHGNCNLSAGIRCSVSFGSSVVVAWDSAIGTSCSLPVYRISAAISGDRINTDRKYCPAYKKGVYEKNVYNNANHFFGM